MRPSIVAAAVALAGRAVAHDEDAGLEQRAIERLDALRRQPEKLGLARRRGQTIGREPASQSCPCVIFTSQAIKLEGLRRQAEIGLGLLKGGEESQRLRRSRGNAFKAVGLLADGQHGQGQPAAAFG